MHNVNVSLQGQGIIRLVISGLIQQIIGGEKSYAYVRLNIGRINPANWDFAKARPSKAYTRREGPALHNQIDKACADASLAYAQAVVKTADEVRKAYDQLTGKIAIVKPSSTVLVDVVQRWIDKAEKNELTIASYRAFLTKAKAYGKIELATATTEELEAFVKWVRITYRLNENSAASGTQKLLNAALNSVKKSGVPVKAQTVKLYSSKTPHREVLDWDDIAKLVAFVPKTKGERDYRTLALLYHLTGCRIHDTWRLLDSIEKRGGYLCGLHTQSKNETRKPVVVSPLILKPLADALKEHGRPERRSEQVIRRGVARIVRKAGVDKDINVHDGRRSFITCMLAVGVLPSHLIAKIWSGHSLNSGEAGVFHSYDQGSFALAHRTACNLLKLVPADQTGGLQLV